MKFRTESAAQTRQLAAAFEPLLQPGDVLLLSGDLGAGKTVFVQGLAAALGIAEQVTSPTFTLAQSYRGRLRLHHLDVYRLDDPAEVRDLDLPELLDDDAVLCVEWGEVVISEVPRDFAQVSFRLVATGFEESAGLGAAIREADGTERARSGPAAGVPSDAAPASFDARDVHIETVGPRWQERRLDLGAAITAALAKPSLPEPEAR